jgi:hypothetical protein
MHVFEQVVLGVRLQTIELLGAFEIAGVDYGGGNSETLYESTEPGGVRTRRTTKC